MGDGGIGFDGMGWDDGACGRPGDTRSLHSRTSRDLNGLKRMLKACVHVCTRHFNITSPKRPPMFASHRRAKGASLLCILHRVGSSVPSKNSVPGKCHARIQAKGSSIWQKPEAGTDFYLCL